MAEVSQQVISIPETIEKKKITESVSYALVSERKVEFTKELADKIAALPEFVGERPLRDSHVAFLINEMKRGTFLSDIASLITCICEWDGVERRLNGQHTCWARTYMPDNWDCKIKLIKYTCPTEDDFRRLYASIDRGAPRTPAHVLHSRLFGTENFKGFSQDVLRLLGTGLRLLCTNPAKKTAHDYTVTVDVAADMLDKEYLHVAQAIGAFVTANWKSQRSPESGHMWRGPVFAAMLATFQKNISASAEFWTAVESGIGIDSVDDPRGRLRTLLMQVGVKCGVGAARRKSLAAEEILRLCIQCWNLWRAGDACKLLRVAEKRPAAK